jgi:phenylpropionate dioxygenase-like ring-hydroxylating dioxygenase large terminal subunit
MSATQPATATDTLPYRWYSDPAVEELERELIFRRHWQYAGHLGELDGPGSMVPTRVGGLPVVLVLDREGELRAFLNVCRHRGAVLVQEPQRRGTIQCPYHAWTYGLGGELRAAPRSKHEPGFEAEGLGLVPVAVDSWGPFVFVNPDLAAAPLSEALGDLPRTVAAAGLDIERLRFHRRVPYTIAANWKIGIENYLECYHCRLNHPDLMHVIDEDRLTHELSGLRMSQFAPPHPDALSGRAVYDAHGELATSQFHLLFPTLKLNTYPGRPNLSIGPMWPEGTDRAAAWLDYFFADGEDPEWVEAVFTFDDQVGVEDRDLVAAVQQGAGSGALPGGRLLAESEVLIAAFQGMVRERIAHALP